MNWKSIRLELGRTAEHPHGSVSRAFLLRLPLRDDGRVDEDAHRRDPALATIRRFWPNEPDYSGYLVRMPDGWASSAPHAAGGRRQFELADQPIRAGAELLVRQADGRRLPFRVAHLEPLSAASRRATG